MNLQIIEVPSPLGLRPSGLEHAPGALRIAGLHERLGSPDAVRNAVPPYSAVRDPATEILNPKGIAAVARDTADAVSAALDSDRFPVLLGGDCSIVLGPLLALRRRGRYGLAFLDGHADFQHPRDEPNGEVASLDLAVATGRVLVCSLTSMGSGRWSWTTMLRSSATASSATTTTSSASTSAARP